MIILPISVVYLQHCFLYSIWKWLCLFRSLCVCSWPVTMFFLMVMGLSQSRPQTSPSQPLQTHSQTHSHTEREPRLMETRGAEKETSWSTCLRDCRASRWHRSWRNICRRRRQSRPGRPRRTGERREMGPPLTSRVSMSFCICNVRYYVWCYYGVEYLECRFTRSVCHKIGIVFSVWL